MRELHDVIAEADANEWWAYSIDLRRLKGLFFALQNGRCAICDGQMSLKKSTIEHVWPKQKRRREGKNMHVHNILLAHEACNKMKMDNDPPETEVMVLERVNSEIRTIRKEKLRRAKSGPPQEAAKEA